MATTLREMDNAAEAAISKYLDKYFYPVHTKNCIRYNDYATQMSGVDVKFDFKELVGILVDEKALTHYINKNLPTFAFEINFLSAEKRLIPGWFFDDNKATQYYLLSWVTAKKDDGISAEDITSLDTLLISRKRIIDMLATYDATKEYAEGIAADLRERNISGVSHKERQKPFYFFFSTQLAEQPINLIIHKSKLEEIATARFTIQPTI
jgi:hypothetical protein